MAIVNLTEWLKSINYTKINWFQEQEKDGILIDTDQLEKEYLPFIINRTLSNSSDTVLYAQLMNERPFMTNKMQYDFLLRSIPAKKRFTPWQKRKQDDVIDTLMACFKVTRKRAEEYKKVLSEDQIKDILQKMNKGGLKKQTDINIYILLIMDILRRIV